MVKTWAEGVMAYKMPSPEGKCILYAITPECACLNQYSTRCSNNTHKYAVKLYKIHC